MSRTSAEVNPTKKWQIMVGIFLMLFLGIIVGGLVMFVLLPSEQRTTALYTVGLIPPTSTLTPTPTNTPTPTATFTPNPTITPTPTAVAFQNNAMGIIVANFGGNTTIEEEVVELLTSQNLNYARVYEDVNNDMTARSLGEQYNAALVIWGLVENEVTSVFINVTRSDFQQVERTIVEENSFGTITMHMGSMGIDVVSDDDITLINDYLNGALSYLQADYRSALVAFEQVQTVLLETERTEEAASLFALTGIIHILLDERELAAIDLQQSRRLDDTQPTTFYLLGHIFSAQGAHNEAIQMYTQALSFDPENLTYLNSRGIAYGESENYEAALADFDEAIRIDPDFGRSYYNRGVAYLNSASYLNAIPDLTRAIDLEVEVAMAHFNRGTAYAQNREYTLAIGDFSSAIEINPSLTLAYYYRGLSYSLSDPYRRYNRALADMNVAIEREPTNTRFLLSRADLHFKSGNYDDALPEYNYILELDPDNLFAWANRTNIYLNNHQYDLVISEVNTKLETTPDYFYAYYLLANAYLGLEDTTQNQQLALENFTRSIELNPEYMATYIYRGQLYFDMQEYDLARADVERALDLNNDQTHEHLLYVLEDLMDALEDY